MDKTTDIWSIRIIPARGKNEPTGSNSPPAWLQLLCYGKREAPGAAPYCNPGCKKKIGRREYQLNLNFKIKYIFYISKSHHSTFLKKKWLARWLSTMGLLGSMV